MPPAPTAPEEGTASERGEVAVPEPEDDQGEETEVGEDEAEQVKGDPQTVSYFVNIG